MATPNEQLQAMRSMGENWDGYGGSAPNGDVTNLAQELVGLIESMLKKSTANPVILHASPTRVGGVLIEWADALTEHEVEISPDQSIGFLHHNKSTGHIETRKFSPGQAIVPPGFLHELRQLLAA